MPWMATIDSFQNWIYKNPNHTRAERVVKWLEIQERFGSKIEYDGINKEGENLEKISNNYPNFLELRKNTGDDRRRTHDMNTANWIPDLFMKRVMSDQKWTLFSPDTVPDLHDKYGEEFERAYISYEIKARNGELKPTK